MVNRRWRVLLMMVLIVLTPRSTVDTSADCEFILDFATLKAAIDEAEGPERVGACLENQRSAANGNAEQNTTGGQLVWLKQDNFTAFTDGYRTWAIGPQGLQVRLNTESFPWEGRRHYRGVALGGREDNIDIRAWIDNFGTLGQGRQSFDHWVRTGKPRDPSGIPLTDSLAVALSRLDRISAEELDEKRQRLITLLWGKAELPNLRTPHSVTKGFSDPRYALLENLTSIDRIVVQMDFWMNSIIYLFHPRSSNGRLLIYHHGHLGDFYLGIDTIQFFLRRGYTVAAFSMPLRGMNARPSIENQGERLVLQHHGDLMLLESEGFSPLKLFVEPVVVLLNYALPEYDYQLVAMLGVSGGGWTTTLAAALDERIDRSYPVAGSLPIYFEEPGRDYEQAHPQLYDRANYMELYVLGTYGGERRQLQVLNRYDPCCFSGTNYVQYEEEVARTAQRVGSGSFRVFSDDTHREHKLSKAALSVILTDLERQ